MTPQTAYEALVSRFERIALTRETRSILSWDMQTTMPAGAAEGRGRQMAYLEALEHELMTSPEMPELLSRAEEAAPEDPWAAANLREMRRSWTMECGVDAHLVEALSIAGTRTVQVWREARPKNDFASLRPHLTEVVALVREAATQRAAQLGVTPYDAMIDRFEPGMTAARLEQVFAPLRTELPGILDAALGKRRPARSPSGTYSVEAQRRLGVRVMSALGFDFNRGRLDVSAHPFCGGVCDDIRITTRYNESDFTTALMGVVHETGHALYEAGLPEAWRYQPVGQARGMGLHESQSLFVEMQLARSPAFLGFLAPLVTEELGQTWTVDDLVASYHRVERGLIRVDADEVTYPFHVLLRFELEQRIFDGSLSVADLPDAWRAGMKTWLGVEPPDDRNGCMQDIHWMDGAFGYFPSYTLGAMLAAQLFAALRRDLPNVDDLVRGGEFAPVIGWLRTHVHAHASRWSSEALVVHATGAPLGADAFLAHLRRRYVARE